jgi:tripartite-type tricarboxylate transporter receptor subunit TctC
MSPLNAVLGDRAFDEARSGWLGLGATGREARSLFVPGRIEVLGKHTELSLFAGPEFLLFQAQGIKPLVMFSEARLPELPDVPTAKEIGVGTVFEERVIAFAPKGTPKDRLDIIAGALRAALDDPELVERYKGLGIDRVFIEGDKLRKLLDGLKGPITKVGDLVRKAKAEQGEKKN